MKRIGKKVHQVPSYVQHECVIDTCIAQEALLQGKTPIIIDNTNTTSREMKPYVEMVSTGMYVQLHVACIHVHCMYFRRYSPVIMYNLLNLILRGNLMLIS